MFIHIGGEKMVSLRDVIGIFAIHNSEPTDLTGLFPGHMKSESLTMVQSPGGEIKSAVLTPSHVYLSPISSLTLKRRAENLYRDLEDMETEEKPD